MKIKKLELVGFKSFVDRTVIHFDHDVLAIVGPNGCGKSNIVDAIRWCMGEQSARHLRGRSMEDVIFSGSETRGAQDFAEVTLTFENDTPEEMALEYKEYAEIAVTRRLLSDRRERLSGQQDRRPAAGRDRPVSRNRRRHEGVLDRRAGQGRPHREREGGRPAAAHRRGCGDHQVHRGGETHRQLQNGARSFLPGTSKKPTVTAMEEVRRGLVQYDDPSLPHPEPELIPE